LGEGLDHHIMREELEQMTDVLLGRIDPPIDRGAMTMMECAEAFHARASEMEMQLLEAEAAGHVLRGSRTYKFRTGMLRTFIEMCKRSMDLGSRRVTYEKMLRDEIG
jgi:hypothetical protein